MIITRSLMLFLMFSIFLVGCVESESKPVYDSETQANLSLCKNINDLADRHSCIKNLAIDKKNVFICNEIRNEPDHMTNAKDLCLIYFAKTSKNTSICSDMETEQSLCYAAVAISSNDLSTCENVNDARTRDACYSEVGIDTGNPSACEKISEVQILKDWCYYQVALKNNDNSLCGKIGYSVNSTYRKWCFDYFDNNG